MRYGSVFSGIGGFDLAAQQAGHDVAWTCEVNDGERQFLEDTFGVPCHPDITTLDPSEVDPVDVLTGGSPCQGFSIAGARTGLEHIESRLFADFVRVIDGLAERGLRYAIWENVPGALSQKNEDGTHVFPELIAALALGMDASVDGAADVVRGFDPGVRWNSGLVDGGQRAVAWRVLDSRHFGVPQRRRRVFACVAFGRAAAQRAFDVLLVREGVSGHLAACSQEGPRVAAAVGDGVGTGGVARCLTSRNERYDFETETLVPVGVGGDIAHTLTGEGFDASEDGTGRGTPIVTARLNLRTATRTSGATGAGTPGTGIEDGDGAASTVHGSVPPAVLMTMREGKPGGGKGPLLSEEQSLTLATGNGQVLFEPQGVAENQRGELVVTDHAHAVTSAGGKPGQGYPAALTQYGVRRLTPVECERLQGFPDGWTEPLGSDSARYRACGNAVTVNTVRWIIDRIDKVEATC